MSARFLSCVCVVALSIAACSDESGTPAPGGAGGEGGGGGGSATGSGGAGGQGGEAASSGRVIVGVTHPPDEPYIDAAWLHVVMKVDGAVTREETLGTGESAPIALPLEYAFEDLPDGAEVEILLQRDLTGDGILLERKASTRVVRGRTSLLRVTLSNDACSPCDAGLTCNWGRCLDPYIAPELLEDYSAGWADHSWCKPEATVGARAPTVALGTGFDAFTPLDDQDEIPVYAGDQGGHHVFVALRMRGLRQSSTATLTLEVPDLPATIGPYSSIAVFPDDPAAGHCETLGILFQIDSQQSIDDLLGKPIQLTAEVLDADGDSALVTRSLVLAAEPQF